MNAMTSKEWAECLKDPGDYNTAPLIASIFLAAKTHPVPQISGRMDALAALCLYGQPFGFTHLMVHTLRGVAPLLYDQTLMYQGHRVADCPTTGHLLDLIAYRISDLLPPED